MPLFRSHKGLVLYVGPDALPEAAWKRGSSYVQRLLNDLNSVRIFKRAWPSNTWSSPLVNLLHLLGRLSEKILILNQMRKIKNQSILVTQAQNFRDLPPVLRPTQTYREQGIRVDPRSPEYTLPTI